MNNQYNISSSIQQDAPLFIINLEKDTKHFLIDGNVSFKIKNITYKSVLFTKFQYLVRTQTHKYIKEIPYSLKVNNSRKEVVQTINQYVFDEFHSNPEENDRTQLSIRILYIKDYDGNDIPYKNCTWDITLMNNQFDIKSINNPITKYNDYVNQDNIIHIELASITKDYCLNGIIYFTLKPIINKRIHKFTYTIHYSINDDKIYEYSGDIFIKRDKNKQLPISIKCKMKFDNHEYTNDSTVKIWFGKFVDDDGNNLLERISEIKCILYGMS